MLFKKIQPTLYELTECVPNDEDAKEITKEESIIHCLYNLV